MSALPDYLYADIFDHLDFHALIRLRRAVPMFSEVVDPLLKQRIAQICVKNLRTRIFNRHYSSRQFGPKLNFTIDRSGDLRWDMPAIRVRLPACVGTAPTPATAQQLVPGAAVRAA